SFWFKALVSPVAREGRSHGLRGAGGSPWLRGARADLRRPALQPLRGQIRYDWRREAEAVQGAGPQVSRDQAGLQCHGGAGRAREGQHLPARGRGGADGGDQPGLPVVQPAAGRGPGHHHGVGDRGLLLQALLHPDDQGAGGSQQPLRDLRHQHGTAGARPGGVHHALRGVAHGAQRLLSAVTDGEGRCDRRSGQGLGATPCQVTVRFLVSLPNQMLPSSCPGKRARCFSFTRLPKVSLKLNGTGQMRGREQQNW
ncbi:unnamed protein product, partial [Effrenium voratum]